jgi:hypothetical protein
MKRYWAKLGRFAEMKRKLGGLGDLPARGKKLLRRVVGKSHDVNAILAELEREKAASEKFQTQRDFARAQRDEARDQRDVSRDLTMTAREQRDRARQQRDESRLEMKALKKRSGRGGRAARQDYFQHLKRISENYQAEKEADPSLSNVSVSSVELEAGIVGPVFEHVFPARVTPPSSVAFATVCNAAFVPGLEVLISSFINVYPDFCSDVIVYHDGTITPFVQARIKSIYKNTLFQEPDMAWMTDLPQDSANRKRIGILGYMSVMALSLTSYERVIVLDSDVAIVDDISRFWTGIDQPLGTMPTTNLVDTNTVFTCHDFGARPWVAMCRPLGKPIINSGIISIPRRYMSDQDLADIKKLVIHNGEKFCPLLDRFADQKAWNRFLAARDVEILPINFNCNIKYLDQYRAGDLSFVRMVHFAGYKPWFDPHFINRNMIPERDEAAVMPAVWQDLCSTVYGRVRQAQYTRETARVGYFAPAQTPRDFRGKKTAMFVGNGPSLQKTDLTRFETFETFVFNWFVLHPEFDAFKPNHLCLASHMFFGGWHTQEPSIPQNFLDALRSRSWKPVIWTSFYFREYIEQTNVLDGYDVRYVLFEKPQKNFIDATGLSNLNPKGFVQDGRTGVLSVALPVAYEMGYRQFGLVGCDSNYNQTEKSKKDGNYFYDKAKHTSLETTANSLTETWTIDGPGFFAYRRQQEALAAQGGGLVDFTIDGSLPLPKGDLRDL